MSGMYDPRKEYNSAGIRGSGGNPKPTQPTSAKQKSVYWPCIGEILAVYHVDSKQNRSALESNRGFEEDLVSHSIGSFQKNILPISNSSGYKIECDIQIIKGFEGVVDGFGSTVGSTETLLRVPVNISFGGIHNYGFVMPRARQNSTGPGGYGDGDLCIVQFIGGDQYDPIVTGFYPNRHNTFDGPKTFSGNVAKFSFNGLKCVVNDSGNFVLDGRDAGSVRELDPRTGSIIPIKPSGDGTAGRLSFITKGDITIGAGASSISAEEVNLPGGKMLLRSAKDMTISSQYGAINIDTVFDKGPITLQGMHGGARNAARKGDKVKIVHGAGGDLFGYLGALKHTLMGVGTEFLTGSGAVSSTISQFSTSVAASGYAVSQTISQDIYTSDLKQGHVLKVLSANQLLIAEELVRLSSTLTSLYGSVGLLIEAFSLLAAAPTSAEGYITEGSSLVKIGSDINDTESSASNLIKEDTLNLLDQLSDSDVNTLIGSQCTIDALTSIISNTVSGVSISNIFSDAENIIKSIKDNISDSETGLVKISKDISDLDAEILALEQEKLEAQDVDDNDAVDLIQEEIDSKTEQKQSLQNSKNSLTSGYEDPNSVLGDLETSEESSLVNSQSSVESTADDALEISSGSGSVIEKINALGLVVGEDILKANINACYEEKVSDIISDIPENTFDESSIKALDAKIKELAPSLSREERKTIIQAIQGYKGA